MDKIEHILENQQKQQQQQPQIPQMVPGYPYVNGFNVPGQLQSIPIPMNNMNMGITPNNLQNFNALLQPQPQLINPNLQVQPQYMNPNILPQPQYMGSNIPNYQTLQPLTYINAFR